jgi:hypothetical protein
MDKNNSPRENSKYTGNSHGMQGIDKAPGEEPATDNVQFTRETQKAKKVDADLDNPNEQASRQDLEE